MKIQQLNEIISVADKKKIISQLKSLEFFECKKFAETKCITTEMLRAAYCQKSDDVADKKGKLVYSGEMCTRVQGWEQYVFIILGIDKRGKDGSTVRKAEFVFASEIEM